MRAAFLVAAVVSLLVPVSPCLAQPGIPPLDLVVSQRSVQTELQLAPDQLRDLSQFSARQRAAWQQLTNLPMNQRSHKMQELAIEVDKGVMDLLKPAQKFRLRQIQWQLQGSRAFADADLIRELNLTTDQQLQIGVVLDRVRGQTQHLAPTVGQGRPPHPETVRKEVAQVDRPALTQINSLLTADQRTRWKDALGRPFAIDFRYGPGGPPSR